MRIAIGQINCTVGDLSGNSRKILEFAARAQGAGRRYTRYTGTILVWLSAGRSAAARGFSFRMRSRTGCAGRTSPRHHGCRRPSAAGRRKPLQRRFRAAGRPHRGQLSQTGFTQLHGIDEERYFDSDGSPCVVDINGVRVGVNICEDVWGRPAKQQRGHQTEIRAL